VLVTARDEAQRLPRTLGALAASVPGARVVVADDGSRDATAAIARAAGVEVLTNGGARGKGEAATLAARHLLRTADEAPERMIVLLCDADLGESAGQLGELVSTVARGDADLAVAAFVGAPAAGLGVAVGFARWSLQRRCGLTLDAPISGQRALRGDVLAATLPFAHGFGMEMGMTIDARRNGYRVHEIPLHLQHRATGRDVRGFVHRGRQLLDFARVHVRSRSTSQEGAAR
jgi:glycosyltransferase involved in cell wall biosynthesis